MVIACEEMLGCKSRRSMSAGPVTGLYYDRARWYSPSLGTWISQDPLQYINGANTYQFVAGNPVGRVDPIGLFDKGGPNSQDWNAGQTGPMVGRWEWKRLSGGKWEGTRGVTQRLGTVITNGLNPSKYGLLRIIEKIMKFIPAGATVIERVNHILETQDIAHVRYRYRATSTWTEHEIVCAKGGKVDVSKAWVTGRKSRATEFGPNGGEILPGQREASEDVVKGAYDVAKEIAKFLYGGG